MRVVIDTNVVVSGLLKPYSAAGTIMRMAAAGVFNICYDSRIISEYRDVLLRDKFSFKKVHVEALLAQILYCGDAVSAEPVSIRLKDPDDGPFLEVAAAGKADCIVTGNIKHFPHLSFKGIKILSPEAFLNYYMRKK